MSRKLTSQSLYSAIDNDMVQRVSDIVQQVDPTLDDCKAIKLAYRRADLFETVLSSPFVNPMSILDTLIDLMYRYSAPLDVIASSICLNYDRPFPYSTERTMIVLDHPRLDVEKLTQRQLRILTWGLGTSVDSKVSAYGRSRRVMGLLMEGKSPDSILLRYIMLKDPSNGQLLDWMIAKKDRSFGLAAQHVLEMTGPLVPIEGLLISIVWPTMDLDEIEDEFRKMEVNEESIALAYGLIGVQRAGDHITDVR